VLLKVTSKFNIRFRPPTSSTRRRTARVHHAPIFPVDTLGSICYKV